MNDTQHAALLRLPILLLKDLVPFPRSRIALDRPLGVDYKESLIFAMLQNGSAKNTIGTICKFNQHKSKSKKQDIKPGLDGLYRGQLIETEICDNITYGYISKISTHAESASFIEPLFQAFLLSISELTKTQEHSFSQAVLFLQKNEDREYAVDLSVSYMDFISLQDKQKILEARLLSTRIELAMRAIEEYIATCKAAQGIRESIREQIQSHHTHAFLREQLKATQKALGEYEGESAVIDSIKQKIEKSCMSAEVKQKAEEELRKLGQMNPISSEASITRNYLDWLLMVPWGMYSAINKNITKAQEIINSQHYGLKDIKQRILEYIAVCNRVEVGQVLCLVGPPGVGKTSLAKSMAEAMGRNFASVSLGGLKDPSEIYGHRKTYIGAMPGKIIQTICKAGSMNCVILLDEIDKMSSDWRGDPASALLPILDPEQNNHFKDHYFEEIGIDLSKVIFIATANTTDIPLPLLDRMEIIDVPSYTQLEKAAIVSNHLLSKELIAHGCTSEEVSISPDAINKIITCYTQEAGIRKLKRSLGKVIRKVVYQAELDDSKSSQIYINAENLHEFLGMPKYTELSYNTTEQQVGSVMGLCWTQYGGTILQLQSAIIKPGKGEVIMTGKLGKVMQESARTALSLVRARASLLNINDADMDKVDIHIHAPEGAIEKDGPSAGIALATALASRMSNRAIKGSIAMTGEVDLNGNVLPVGGIKEKILAAQRNLIKTILIPAKNRNDLHDISSELLADTIVLFVDTIDDVWNNVF